MNKMEQLSKLLQTWKKQRRLYPGWVIVPEDRRSELWLYTEKWLSYLPTGDDLPSLVDLEFAFELNWRMEKCLCPILDNQGLCCMERVGYVGCIGVWFMLFCLSDRIRV